MRLRETNKKLPKTKLHKIGQSGEFLGRLLGSLLKIGSPLLKNVLKPLLSIIMLLSTLGASLLRNLLTGKGTIRVGEGTIKAGWDFYCCLIL